MSKIPTAISDQACLISMTRKTVTIDCDTRQEAEELFEWLLKFGKKSEKGLL